MTFNPRILCLAVLLGALCGPTYAKNAPFACDDNRTRGWNFYCDKTEQLEEKEPEKERDITPVAPPAPPTSTELMEKYRLHVEEMKNRAILDPTPENLVAYMEVQKELVQRATRFTEQWQRQVFANPTLDANVKRPITSTGGNLYQDQLDVKREAAVRDATVKHALMFVFEDEAACYLCPAQAEIIQAMSLTYEFPVLAVSKDGSVSEHFPDAQVNGGQLANLKLDDVPTPFVALLEPKSGQVDLVGAGLMTQDTLVDRIRVIHAIPEGELYE